MQVKLRTNFEQGATVSSTAQVSRKEEIYSKSCEEGC